MPLIIFITVLKTQSAYRPRAALAARQRYREVDRESTCPGKYFVSFHSIAWLGPHAAIKVRHRAVMAAECAEVTFLGTFPLRTTITLFTVLNARFAAVLEELANSRIYLVIVLQIKYKPEQSDIFTATCRLEADLRNRRTIESVTRISISRCVPQRA